MITYKYFGSNTKTQHIEILTLTILFNIFAGRIQTACEKYRFLVELQTSNQWDFYGQGMKTILMAFMILQFATPQILMQRLYTF